MRRWIYKIGGGESRIVEGDVPEGYQDRPWEEGQDKPKQERVTKNKLEKYAREKYGVELDKRKNIEELKKIVEELDNGSDS